MRNATIKKVAIVGAGTMGQGIVHLCASSGFKALWYDVDNEILEKGLKKVKESLKKGVALKKITAKEMEEAVGRIEVTTNINDLTAELIIEAVVENLQVKIKVFEALEKINSSSTILATNTSSIPITSIASKLQHPERVIGLHFFNPAHIMKLVEIISGAETKLSVKNEMHHFAKKLGKTPVFAQDSPGFIVNRVARHYYVESLRLLEEGVADFETIDKLMESSGLKMGPFRLMDLIGIDVNYAVTLSMYNSFHQDPKFRPSRIQQQKVIAGHHGVKSKKGFYEY